MDQLRKLAYDEEAVLSVRGIYKSFGGIKALSDVDLDLYDKELLVILGDNGAGKSTLVKIISGAYASDQGEIYIYGRKVKISSPQDAKRFGIKIIYQDLALFEVLDVTQNFFMGEQLSIFGFLRNKTMDTKSKEILQHLKTGVKSLRQRVEFLSGGQQHAVAIGRGVFVGTEAKIIIMDEPAAGLGVEESNRILELLKEMRDRLPVILITHNLDHVFEVADRAIVLREGKVNGIVRIAESNKEEIINLMIGK